MLLTHSTACFYLPWPWFRVALVKSRTVRMNFIQEERRWHHLLFGVSLLYFLVCRTTRPHWVFSYEFVRLLYVLALVLRAWWFMGLCSGLSFSWNFSSPKFSLGFRHFWRIRLLKIARLNFNKIRFGFFFYWSFVYLIF